MPARPVGVNIPDLLFNHMGIGPGTPADALAHLQSARAHGITHVRFIASGYWPVDMTTGNGWVNAPTQFFAAFDGVLADAEAAGVRLVPSLLWNMHLFPDLAGQPLSALLTPGSTTRLLAERFITEVVTRYRDRDVILAWEIGNEHNLLADLDFSSCTVCSGQTPNACGALAPSLGTPCSRTAADNFSSCHACRGVSSAQQDLGEFAGAMATLIRAIDADRPVSTGHAYPRPSAWHLARSPCPSCDWTLDNETQYRDTLAQLHPDPVGWVSVHHYGGADAARFGSTDPGGVTLLEKTQAAVQALVGKELYVGEYGEPRAGSITCGGVEVCGGEADPVTTRSVLDEMIRRHVPWSALWAWEFNQFCADVPTCYGVGPTDELATTLPDWAAAPGSCAGMPDDTACPIGWCRGGTCEPREVLRREFSSSADVTDFLHWTNCTGCTPATLTVNAGRAELRTFDLPCGSGCQYPGGYATTPPFDVAGGGRLFLRAVTVSSAPGVARVLWRDSAAQEVGQLEVPLPGDGAAHVSGDLVPIPTGAITAVLRLELVAPSSQLVVDQLVVDVRP